MNQPAKTLAQDAPEHLVLAATQRFAHGALAPALPVAAVMCVLTTITGSYDLAISAAGAHLATLRAMAALAALLGAGLGAATRGYWGLAAATLVALNLTLAGAVASLGTPGVEIALAVGMALSATGFAAAALKTQLHGDRQVPYSAATWAVATALPVGAVALGTGFWAGSILATLAVGGALVWMILWTNVWPGWGHGRALTVLMPFISPHFLDRKAPSGRPAPVAAKPAPKPAAARPKPRQGTDERDIQSVETVVPSRVPTITFQNVVGMDDLKRRLLDSAEEINAYWARPAEERERDPLPPRNGILLTGEPGNGKSFIAEALAGELGVDFFRFTQGDIASRWVNQTTEQLIAAFREAEQHPGCVFFIDELDSLLSQRSENAAASGAGEGNKLVNTFLTHAEQLRRHQVILMGATNHPELLDDAAIREGRFDFKIQVPPPDRAARGALAGQLGKLCGREIAISEDDMTLILDNTEGLAATRILALVRELAVEIRREHGTGPRTVTYKDFSAALNVIRGQMGLRLPEDTPDLGQVMLCEETRASLDGLAWRLTHARETLERGGSVPSGVLFFGPPGTGKTLAARALAKATDWNFIATSGAELTRTHEGISRLMARAKAARPVLVFIDEADDILANRANFAATPALNELLQAMDGAGGRLKNVLFVAATNRIEAMDPAALRGGRFSEKLAFPLPDAALTRKFVELWLSRSRARFEPEVSAIAEALGELAYANIEAALQAAANRAVARAGALVTLGDVVASRDEVCVTPIRKS